MSFSISAIGGGNEWLLGAHSSSAYAPVYPTFSHSSGATLPPEPGAIFVTSGETQSAFTYDNPTRTPPLTLDGGKDKGAERAEEKDALKQDNAEKTALTADGAARDKADSPAPLTADAAAKADEGTATADAHAINAPLSPDETTTNPAIAEASAAYALIANGTQNQQPSVFSLLKVA
jgi:hypothetical protein